MSKVLEFPTSDEMTHRLRWIGRQLRFADRGPGVSLEVNNSKPFLLDIWEIFPGTIDLPNCMCVISPYIPKD